MAKVIKKKLNIAKLADKQPLSERVYKAIKKSLLEGQFAPGELLPEDFWTDVTGASRTPVREALMRLQGDGLVEIIPRRGARVLEMDVCAIQELAQARWLIETGFLETALNENSLQKIEEFRSQMAAVLKDMSGIDSNSEAWAAKRLEYSKLDFAFHRFLVEAVGNRFLLKYYDEIQKRLIIYIRHTVIKFPDFFLQSAREHEAIIAALLNKDSVLAGKLLSSHFEKLNCRIENALND